MHTHDVQVATIDRRPTATQWLECWGEIERIRATTGDFTALPHMKGQAGKRRGKHSIPDALLIHAQVDGWLKQCGRWIHELARKLWALGWEWEEVQGSDGLTVWMPKYDHDLRHHQIRLLQDVRRQMAKELNLRNQ